LKIKHTYVVLIDLPEALPFELKLTKAKPEELKELDHESKKSEEKLFEFVSKLEKNLKEEFSFIGEDIIGEKFYKRFLLPKSGFMEIMYQPPAAIIAHFLDIKRAKAFAKALKKTIDQTIADDKLKTILKNMVEVNTEKEEVLTYEKWSKLKEIRGLTEV
jgi:adenylate kinase family enzyme